MSENSKAQTSLTRLMLLTGGLITSGAVGWSLFRMFKSQQIDYNEMMYAGGMGILSSVIILKYRKSSDSQRKSITSEKDASNMNVLVCETSAPSTHLDRVNEWHKIFACEAGLNKVLDEKISRYMKQEAHRISSKYNELTNRLNDLDRQRQKNELQDPPADNQLKTCYNEGKGSSKANIREEITAHINVLKSHVRGTSDPFPLAKNIQFPSTEMNDEKCREIAMKVKEYANTMLSEFKKVIDEFVYFVCEAGEVRNNKKHSFVKSLEALGVEEEDLLTTVQKFELNQFCRDFEQAMKSGSRIPYSCQIDPRSRNVSGVDASLLESVPSQSL